VSGVCTATNPTEAVFFQTALTFSPNGANHGFATYSLPLPAAFG
jgi:hypothetical protein